MNVFDEPTKDEDNCEELIRGKYKVVYQHLLEAHGAPSLEQDKFKFYTKTWGIV